MRTTGVSATLVDDLTIAVYEALANVVEHAYPSDHPEQVMRLRAQFDYNQVLITISDQGSWRTPAAAGSRGRGLIIMRYLATDVQLHATDHGTTVQLRVDLRYSGDGCAPKEPASAP